MRTKTFALFALAATLTVAPALAGVVFQVETTHHSGSAGTESSEMSVERPNLKMGIAAGADGRGKGEMIFRGARREVVVVDHQEKSYTVMDEETLDALAGQVAGMMGPMQEALKNLPESERRKIEEMMKQRMPSQGLQRPPSQLRRTGERATKNGYPCVKYEIWREGSKIRELWVTDWSRIDGGGEVRDVWRELTGFMRRLTEKLASGLPGGGLGGPGGDPIFEHMEEIDGFPVVTRSFEGGELDSETVLQSVTERDLDPDAFEPPKGYRLRTMGPR